MFRRDKLTVLAWIVLIIILSIPVVNVIFAVIMFIRRKTSATVKNFFIAYLILYILAAWFGFFNISSLFATISGLLSNIIG
jgi:hypothetical protein